MVLQNRWKIQGKYLIYFGIRKLPYTTKNKIKLNARQQKILSLHDIPNDKKVRKFVEQGIVVEKCQQKVTPKSLADATFCKQCVANDFMIAGIEFDENGLCPMCAAKKQDKELVSILPLKTTIPPSKNSRFDVAVFYTGGKDSTYLLYYLAKVLKLRVLALTWEIPFMSENAKKSIENAKKHFENVEFVNRTVSAQHLHKLYSKLIELQNNTCACPSLAYAIFYPTLCHEKIPYLVLGNEPVQMRQLFYNNLAPRIAFGFQKFKSLHFLLNVLRILTLKKPLKSGQLEMLMLVKQLACGESFFKRISGYQNQLVNNVCTAMEQIPNLKSTLRRAVRFSDRRACMPSLVHLDLDSISPEGKYHWQKVKQLLCDQCGWVAPDDKNKNLHTSCLVEPAKDFSQFVSFFNMQSTLIPFSALEISLATSYGNISKEDALREIQNSSAFCFEAPPQHAVMLNCKGCPVEYPAKTACKHFDQSLQTEQSD